MHLVNYGSPLVLGLANTISLWRRYKALVGATSNNATITGETHENRKKK